ncbi:hypothetical protein [Clostridium sp.]|nr:hypothetical protein [Clostridium sp.]MDU3410030.1 hypothetical protein [Clostridium sp.]
MQKKTKIVLVIGAVALILSLGVIGSTIIRPFGDPPFTLINLK